MSVYVSSWVWRYAECQDNEMLLLLALADMANDEGVAWPSVEMLAKRCRCDVRTVQRNLAKAISRGTLKRVLRSGAVNIYRFTAFEAQARGDTAAMSPRQIATPALVSPGGDTLPGEEKRSFPPIPSSREGNVKETSVCTREHDFFAGEVPNKKKRVSMPKTESLEEVATYAVKIGATRSDGVYCFNHWRTNDWTIAGRPIRDWKSCMIAWREAGHLPSQKNGGLNGRNR